ncbi:hypothetical protein MTO96_005141 [Rhipicephalus appendiculatus]
MATATQRGYDPAAMAWTETDVQQAATTQHEPTNIEDEGLFQLMTVRQKASQQKMMSKPAAGNPGGPVSNGRARAAQPKGNLIKWRPRDTPKMSADDIIVVLKHRETLHQKTAFQTGDLGAAIAQSKTSKASGNEGASSGKSGQATGPAPANKTSKKDKKRNVCGQSAKTPVSQEGDFPSLDNSKATTTEVSNWEGVAATFSSSPSPLELELKKEIAFLRTKNEQLEQKINAPKAERQSRLYQALWIAATNRPHCARSWDR